MYNFIAEYKKQVIMPPAPGTNKKKKGGTTTSAAADPNVQDIDIDVIDAKKEKRNEKVQDTMRTYSIGDQVLVFNPAAERLKGRSQKFIHKWQGPYVVQRQTSPVNYEVNMNNTRKHKIVHVNRMKPYFGRMLLEEQDSKTVEYPRIISEEPEQQQQQLQPIPLKGCPLQNNNNRNNNNRNEQTINNNASATHEQSLSEDRDMKYSEDVLAIENEYNEWSDADEPEILPISQRASINPSVPIHKGNRWTSNFPIDFALDSDGQLLSEQQVIDKINSNPLYKHDTHAIKRELEQMKPDLLAYGYDKGKRVNELKRSDVLTVLAKEMINATIEYQQQLQA